VAVKGEIQTCCYVPVAVVYNCSGLPYPSRQCSTNLNTCAS